MRALSSFTVSFFSSSRAGTRDLSPAGASVSISADIADRGVTISLRKGGDREKSSRVGEESGRDGAPWPRLQDDAVVAVVVVVVGTKADATKGPLVPMPPHPRGPSSWGHTEPPNIRSAAAAAAARAEGAAAAWIAVRERL